jgi:hypothetical protein
MREALEKAVQHQVAVAQTPAAVTVKDDSHQGDGEHAQELSSNDKKPTKKHHCFLCGKAFWHLHDHLDRV